MFYFKKKRRCWKDLRGHNIYVSTNDYYQQQCQSMINVNQQSVNQQLTAQQAKAG